MNLTLIFFIISILNNFNIFSTSIIKRNVDHSLLKNYNKLFDSIDYDYFNLSLIYKYNYKSIKIKHKSFSNETNKITCVLGVLVNQRGINIANSMLEWLMNEYDVYCVYQKFPGDMYEYPALRFAQWYSLKYNKSIILYLHTKGAFNIHPFQDIIRSFWKHEFTKPNNYIYIQLLSNNITDVALPFRRSTCTWYNGMFISQRAFSLINEIPFYETIERHFYECLTFFQPDNFSYKIRFKGILSDFISTNEVMLKTEYLAKYFDTIENYKNNIAKKSDIIMDEIKLIVLIILCYILYKIKQRIKLLRFHKCKRHSFIFY